MTETITPLETVSLFLLYFKDKLFSSTKNDAVK